MTRARATIVKERTALLHRLHRILESANIKLSSVDTNLPVVSAKEMLLAITQGTTEIAALVDLAKGRLRSQKAELERAKMTGQSYAKQDTDKHIPRMIGDYHPGDSGLEERKNEFRAG